MYGNTLYPRIKSFLVLYEGRCSYFHETRARRDARVGRSRVSRGGKKKELYIDDTDSRNPDRLPINVSRDRKVSAILRSKLFFLGPTNCEEDFALGTAATVGPVIEERPSRETSVINFRVSIGSPFRTLFLSVSFGGARGGQSRLDIEKHPSTADPEADRDLAGDRRCAIKN